MKNNFQYFSSCAVSKVSTVKDRAISFLYYRSKTSRTPEASPKEIVNYFVIAGLGSPNITRLKTDVAADPRTSRVGKDKWRIRSDKFEDLEKKFSSCLGNNKKKHLPVVTDSVIPFELVKDTRGYLENVVKQLNACYDINCFDAAGVMLRRLVETLIIECFEHKKIESKIKDADDNYKMLGDLINAIKTESTITLGRNAKSGLDEIKKLGDQSAHNRRFLAKKADIDRIQHNARVLVEELLSIASLK